MKLPQLHPLSNFKKYTYKSIITLLLFPLLFTCSNKKQSLSLVYKYGLFDKYESYSDLDSVWKKKGNVKWIEEKGDKFIRLVNTEKGITSMRSSLVLDSAWRRIKISGNIRIPELTPLPQFGKTARLFTAFYSNEGDLLSFTGDISPNHITWRNTIEDWKPFEFTFNLPLYVDKGSSKGMNRMEFQFQLNEAVGILDVNDFELEVIDEKQVVSGKIFNQKLLPAIHLEEILGAEITSQDEEKVLKTLHVSPQNMISNDNNEGTEDKPLKSLKQAIKLFSESNQAYKIILHEGKYHEENYLSISDNGKEQPLLIIEAKEKGKAIITGASILTDWEATTIADVYEHKWQYNFGSVEQIWAGKGPWGNSGYIGEKGLRKEMLFVNNLPYLQVFDKNAIANKTFYIDEESDRIFLKLPKNIDIEKAEIEVATKGDLLNVSNKENLVLRNLIFEKAAKFIPFGSVEFSFCKNILIDNCDFLNSNATGLLFNFVENVTLNKVNSSHNGWNGYKFEFARQVITKNCETSYNNWRGNMAGINGWDLAGNKNFNVHYFLIDNHKAYDNRGEGIWFDWCCQNIEIKNSEIIGNHSAGIYWEASQGHAMVKNCRITHNGQSGIRNAEAWNLCLMNNQVYDNYESQLEIRARLRSGEDRYSSPNYLFSSLYLTTQNNVFSSAIDEAHLIELYSMRDSSISIYKAFLETYTGSGNSFFHTSRDTAFSFERHRYADQSMFNRIQRGGRKKLSYWESITSEYQPIWKETSLPRIEITGISNDESISHNKEYNLSFQPEEPLKELHFGYIKLADDRDIHKYYLHDITEIPLENGKTKLNLKETGKFAIWGYGYTSTGSLVVSQKLQINVLEELL